MSHRQEKVCGALKEVAAQYLGSVAGKQSLITVTDCKITPDLKQATILISVFPTDKEEEALHFAKRRRSELHELLKEKLKMKTVPFVEINIDAGEKNRQRVDEVFRKLENN